MTPVNRHIIAFWDSKNVFKDLDEPKKYFSKISASYDSTTPSYARLKILRAFKNIGGIFSIGTGFSLVLFSFE